MPVGVEAWITQIPPITRGWLALSVVTSLAVQCQLVTPLQLYFSPKSAFANAQVGNPSEYEFCCAHSLQLLAMACIHHVFLFRIDIVRFCISSFLLVGFQLSSLFEYIYSCLLA